MKTRKELKDEYKQRKTQMGVFEIRNTINNKIFIDSGIDVNAKWNRHQLQLKMGMHKNKSLQNDWDSQGAQDFVFNVLSEIKHQVAGNPDYHKELVLLEELVRDELQLDENLAY